MNKYVIAIVLSIVMAAFVSCDDDNDASVDLSTWEVTCDVDPRTSMTITVEIPDSFIKISSADKMAVFAGNECRGVVSPQIYEEDDRKLFFLLVAIKQPEDEYLNQGLSLFFYSAARDRVYISKDEDLILGKDQMVGSIDAPYTTNWAIYR